MYMKFTELAAEQKRRPLSYKIETAADAIRAGFEKSVSRAALAFSGGKDSTVLWHLIRCFVPEQAERMAVIFVNTGVEFPESLKFARELGRQWGGDNFYEATPERLEKDELKYEAQRAVLEYLVRNGNIGAVLKPDGKLKTTQTLERACPPEMWEMFEKERLVWKAGTPKSYWWCVDQYGYPILGKSASKLKARRINIDCFLRFSETKSDSVKLREYYDMLRDVKISQACCCILKKEPSEKLQAELKVDMIFKGLMASESRSRKINFCTRGYLFESKRKYIDTPFYHCNPLSIWTDDDIWEYIRRFNVPYSSLYDLTYSDSKGKECKIKRNGCVGCFTDFGRKDSHMFVLRQTHPDKWKAVMRYGMGTELKNMRGMVRKYRKQSVLDGVSSAEQMDWAIENRPCAFD
ncbi:hypothetical protein AGMMS50276_28530 [Synergistales bacterium]|nr:hypothetical protein AGMMS50276_28530 [Synergistales bacterium]